MTSPKSAPPEPHDPFELAMGFAALGDENRLRVVALLGRRPHYGEELAESLGLSPATISHHLRRLREVGLVSTEKQSPYVLYRLRAERMDELVHLLGAPARLADALGLRSEEEFSGHVLRRLLDEDERLREIPTRRRPRTVLVRFLAQQFDTGRIYPEREIRRVLLQYHDDADRLLELLLQTGWLQRSGSVLRRVEEVPE